MPSTLLNSRWDGIDRMTVRETGSGGQHLVTDNERRRLGSLSETRSLTSVDGTPALSASSYVSRSMASTARLTWFCLAA